MTVPHSCSDQLPTHKKHWIIVYWHNGKTSCSSISIRIEVAQLSWWWLHFGCLVCIYTKAAVLWCALFHTLWQIWCIYTYSMWCIPVGSVASRSSPCRYGRLKRTWTPLFYRIHFMPKNNIDTLETAIFLDKVQIRRLSRPHFLFWLAVNMRHKTVMFVYKWLAQ